MCEWANKYIKLFAQENCYENTTTIIIAEVQAK